MCVCVFTVVYVYLHIYIRKLYAYLLNLRERARGCVVEKQKGTGFLGGRWWGGRRWRLAVLDLSERGSKHSVNSQFTRVIVLLKPFLKTRLAERHDVTRSIV